MESHLVFDLETTDYKNPLHLEIDAYPNYIEGNVKDRIEKSYYVKKEDATKLGHPLFCFKIEVDSSPLL